MATQRKPAKRRPAKRGAQRRAPSGGIRSVPLHATALSDLRHLSAWLQDAMGGRTTASGMPVTDSTALTLPAYVAVLRIISQTVALLPRCVYRYLDRGREKLPGHRLTYLVNNPNSETIGFQFWMLMQWNAMAYGNGRAFIERDADGKPLALWPIHPSCIEARRVDGNLWYYWRKADAGIKALRPDEVLDIPGIGGDGINGMSLLRYGAESLGVGLAQQRYAGSFFGNGIYGSGVLEHPLALTDTAFKRLKESIDERFSGPENAHKPLILEEAMKWRTLALPDSDKLLVEAGTFSVVQICRLAGVPPHMLSVFESNPKANVEQLAIEWVRDGVLPRTVTIEQECDRKLFGPRPGQHYFHLNVDGLLRGDFASRMEGYQKGVNAGIFLIDECREREEMNALPDGLGAQSYVQGAVIPLAMAGKHLEIAAKAAEKPAADDMPSRPPMRDAVGEEARVVSGPALSTLLAAHRPTFEDTARRVVRREMKAVLAAFPRRESASLWGTWAERWHAEQRRHVENAFAPALASMAATASAVTGRMPVVVALHGTLDGWERAAVARTVVLTDAAAETLSRREGELSRVLAELVFGAACAAVAAPQEVAGGL